MRVRQATSEDVPALVALFQELDRMQADWRVFTPRPGFYDEVGAKYKEALGDPDQVVLVAEDDEAETRLIASIEMKDFAGGLEISSAQSPIGAALLGASAGDTVSYEGPNGRTLKVEVLKVTPFED